MTHVVVIIGGGELSAEAVASVPEGAFVIAADSGLDHAVAAGIRPDALVGDLDSISAAGRMWAYAHELVIDQQPTDKDLTDTELALATAAGRDGATHLLVLGGSGDRLDHTLGTLLALGHPRLAHFRQVRGYLGGTEVAVVHPGRKVSLDLDPGATFSVLALHGPASGVSVRGARWTLDDADLGAGEARGVSNEAEEQTMVTCTTGVVTVVVP
ncbi:MAG: thiamine diphosphokinase [Actinobacteria bacterium]|nr:thiamine diphosphokinase [Actinomycetota bacterium]